MKNILFTSLFFLSFYSYAQNTIFDVAREGSLNEIKTLVEENPALVNSVSDQGFSPILLAVYYENEAVAKYLIKAGAKVNTDSAYGTPLMAAVVKGNKELVELILAQNPNVNAVDQNGVNAIIYAVMFEQVEILKKLLETDVDLNQQDKKGKSALDYVEDSTNEEIKALLLE